jgi:DNA-binding transcriptional LysR family regulator
LRRPAGARHAFTARARIGLAELAGEPLIGMAEHSAFHAHLAQHARRLGQQLVYRVRLRSFESVCRMVGQGIGVGIVPKAVALRCARSAKIQRVPLSDAFAARSLVLAMRNEDALAPASRWFVQHLLAARQT